MRILIVKLSSLGDLLHALPTAAELHRQCPAQIHWAVHSENAGLVALFSCVERILPIPRRGWLRERRMAFASLRRESYDLVVDLQGLLKSALVTRLARTSRRIGPSFHREGSRLLYSDVAGPRNKHRHAVEECLDVLEHLGLQRPASPRFPLRLPDLPDGPGAAGAALRIAIAPRSRWPSKNWPLGHFAALARRIVDELGAELHLIGGAGDRPAAEAVIRQAGVCARNHCGEHNLGQTCALLARMDALVANDSGPVHMAAAVGTPCVVLFGPTLPDRTGPFGAGHRVLRLGNCPPCRAKRCRRGEAICLSQLPPEQALAAVREVLATPAAGRPFRE